MSGFRTMGMPMNTLIRQVKNDFYRKILEKWFFSVSWENF